MITSDANHHHIRHRACKSHNTTTTATMPTTTSTLDSWLLAASVEAAVAKAAKLPALAGTPAKVAAQVQGQIRELTTEKGRLDSESEVAAAERKTKSVEAKLKRAGTSIVKLRLEVVAVLQADLYELTERHKALHRIRPA